MRQLSLGNHSIFDDLDLPLYLYGRCQETVRKALQAPGGFRSAKDAWNGVEKKYRHSGNVPAGVPFYYKGGTFWHAVLTHSDPDWVWSTDIKRKGKVDLVKRTLVTERWGYPPLGWTQKINGLFVYGSK